MGKQLLSVFVKGGKRTVVFEIRIERYKSLKTDDIRPAFVAEDGK